MESIYILSLNPGSTSTKIAVYRNSTAIFLKTINHSHDDLAKFERIADQYEFRKTAILKELENAEIRIDELSIIMGRGGLIKPIESGVYEVNETMKNDLKNVAFGEHASDLGGLIADDIASSIPGARAFIADPVVVDELEPVARFSGHPAFTRKSVFHALNQKAIARQHAEIMLRKYEEMNVIVAHLGGGITIGAHQKGRVIDVNNGLDGEGPFTPERSGTLPTGALVNMCYSGHYTKEKIKKMIVGEGGMYAYLHTTSAYEVEQKIKAGDELALWVFDAMTYQVAKCIGEMFTVLKCEVDAVLLTGGIANSKIFVNKVIERVFKIAPVYVYPGEDELNALAQNGLKVARGEVIPKIYE